MGDLGGLLLALGNSDVRIRGPAERAELDARTGNFPGYLMALVTHLADETQSPATRQQALILLKNSVALDARSQEKKVELAARWMAVDPTIRDHVKGALLATLAASASEVRYTAALVIANLARVELPLNLWGDLLPGLMATCQRDNDGLMEAALTTLGYICEETNSSDPLREVMQHHSPALLAAICAGMARPSPSVRYFATNALVNSLEFVHGSMAVEAGRDILLRAICDATAAAEERTREKAMECLVKVASLYYEYLPKYIPEILAVTTRALEHDGEKVAMQALQFWCAVCGVELEDEDGGTTAKGNYADIAVSSLVPHLLRCLTKQETGQTEEDWNLSNAASKTLINLAETVGNKILDLVMPFVYQHIASEDWHFREAALMAFGCVISGAEPETVQDLVAQATSGILAYLTDKNSQVADTAAWVLAVMCEDYLDIFTASPAATKTWFDAVVPLFGGSLRPALRAAQIVHNVALQLEEEGDDANGETPTNELSPYFGPLLQMLQHNIDRGSEGGGRLRMETQEAMNALIGAAAKDCYPMLGVLVDEIIRRLAATTVAIQQQQMSAAEGQSYIGLLCGGLMQVTRKLGAGIKDRQRQIMEAMVHVVGTSDASVQLEALQAIGVVANTLKADFLPYLQHVLPAIVKGLETTADEDLCIASIGAVSDIASGLNETFGAPGGPSQQIMTIFVNHLRNPDVTEDIKCTVIQCTGDIALHIGPLFQPYLQVVMTTFGEMDTIIQQLDMKDPDNEEAALNFCEAMCLCFEGILQGFKGALAPVYPYIEAIIAFTTRTAKNFHDPSYDDVFRAAIALIGDLANVISSDAPAVIAHYKPLLVTAEVDQLVRLAEGRTGKDFKPTLENGQFARAELRVLYAA